MRKRIRKKVLGEIYSGGNDRTNTDFFHIYSEKALFDFDTVRKMNLYVNSKKLNKMFFFDGNYDLKKNNFLTGDINLDDLTKPGSTSDRRKSLERKIKRGPPSLKSDAFGIGTAIEEGPRALKKAGQLGVRGASKVLGYGAIPLELYFMNEARKQGKSTAEILAMPLLMEGRVGELQDMMKLTPVERVSSRVGYMGAGFLMAGQWTVEPILFMIGFCCVLFQVTVRRQWNLVVLQLNGLVAWTIHFFNNL